MTLWQFDPLLCTMNLKQTLIKIQLVSFSAIAPISVISQSLIYFSLSFISISLLSFTCLLLFFPSSVSVQFIPPFIFLILLFIQDFLYLSALLFTLIHLFLPPFFSDLQHLLSASQFFFITITSHVEDWSGVLQAVHQESLCRL